MSNKLQIPKAIQDAVRNALASYPVAANTGHAAEIACEAFAKALTENPVIPTHEQAITLCEVFEDKGGSRKPDYCDSIRAVAIDFQRHMFDEPEPTGVDAATGKIIAEARQRAFDEIMACAKNEGIESGIGVDAERVWALALQTQEKRSMEGIKDLLTKPYRTAQDQNSDIIEAYRRGKESK